MTTVLYAFADESTTAPPMPRIPTPAEQKAVLDADAAKRRDIESRIAPLVARKQKATALKPDDLAPYMAANEDYARALEDALRGADRDYSQVAREEVAGIYMNLGDLARFKLHQTGRALAYYDAALRNGGPGRLAAADLLQFDVKDKLAAAKRYREIRVEDPSSNIPLREDMSPFFGAWLQHQVAYLETGKVFTGTIDLRQCGGAAILMIYGGAWSAIDFIEFNPNSFAEQVLSGKALASADSNALAAKLAALPSSTAVLLRTANVVAGLPDAASILAFLARNDPAGYASACYFMVVEHWDLIQPAALPAGVREAAGQFLRGRAVSLKKGDPRKASPEGTWKLYIDSLAKGDARTALDCLTPELQGRNGPLIDFTPQQLREWGEAFAEFKLSPVGADAKRADAQVSQHGQATSIRFVHVLDEWLISSM